MTDLVIEKTAVNTLVSLGLTVLQAKVYIALTKTVDSTGKATAKLAQVASQDVYRVLYELQEKDLVEKIVSKPNRYRATPIAQGLKKLLDKRQQETLNLKKSVSEISKNLHKSNILNKTSEIGDFILIANQGHAKHRSAIESAQTCIDFMNNYENALQGHQNIFDIEIRALKKGIKIRNILYKKEESGSSQKSFLMLKKEADFQVRYMRIPVPKLMVIDKKEMFISTLANENSLSQHFLWSNNQILVQAIQGWYDMMWDRGSASS